MGHESIQDLIGTAIVDAEFEKRLLQDAASVIGDFGLSPDEARVVLSVKAKTLQGFATQMQAWISSTGPSTAMQCR